MNLYRLVLYRRMNETRHDHSVLPGLTRADGVEKPNDDDRQTRLLPVCESEKFVKRFCTGVGPAVFLGRTGKQIVAPP